MNRRDHDPESFFSDISSKTLANFVVARCLDACGIHLSTRTDWIMSGGNTSSSGSGTSFAAMSTPASLVAVSTPAASLQSSSILDCVPPECESIVIEAGGTVS